MLLPDEQVISTLETADGPLTLSNQRVFGGLVSVALAEITRCEARTRGVFSRQHSFVLRAGTVEHIWATVADSSDFADAVRAAMYGGTPEAPGGGVMLLDAGPHLIPVIKAVRGATGLGLREAKDLVDSAPVFVATDRAAQLLRELEEAGARAAPHGEPSPYSTEMPPAAPSVTQPTGHHVFLTDAGESKIKVIKAVREATGLGLREAKNLVDSAPVIVASALDEHAADSFRRQLEAAGARVNVYVS